MRRAKAVAAQNIDIQDKISVRPRGRKQNGATRRRLKPAASKSSSPKSPATRRKTTQRRPRRTAANDNVLQIVAAPALPTTAVEPAPVAASRLQVLRPSPAACNRTVLGAAVVVLTAMSATTAWVCLSSPPPRLAVVARAAAVERTIDAQVRASRIPAETLPLAVAAYTPIPPVNLSLPPISFGELNVAPRSRLGVAEMRELARRIAAEPPARRAGRAADTPKESATKVSLLGAVPGGIDLIQEARRYLGRNPTGWAHNWCGKFLDMVLRHTGRPGGGNLARGYLKYGPHLPGPKVGAIAVFARAGGGHVGIVTGIDSNGNPIIISGNFNSRVEEATYPRRALAYVAPGPSAN
jgi:uncharacterized protein (TIGR02594 family)